MVLRVSVLGDFLNESSNFRVEWSGTDSLAGKPESRGEGMEEEANEGDGWVEFFMSAGIG